MKYYKLSCYRAHTGTKHFDCITFYYKAKDAYSACMKMRKQRGIKRHRLPFSCVEITKEEYEQGISVSAYKRIGAE